MKRDFLKNLGIEDKEIIDKIMDENSADIGKAKGELQTYKDKVTELEGKLTTKEAEVSTLQAQVGDTTNLNNKIAQLEADKTNLTNELNTKVLEIKKDHAIEAKIRDAKGKNIKAIKALLDMEKVTFENEELGGIDDQLDALKGAEDSSMLFGEVQTPPPAGTKPSNPPVGSAGTPATGMSFTDAIAAALNSNK